MDEQERIRLLYGPYATPLVQPGQSVTCARRGKVIVRGLSNGRIPWPVTGVGGPPSLILMGGLITAVRREACQAVAHWWGVSRVIVSRWRRALGVGAVNEGTSRLHRELAQEPGCREGLERARLQALTPEARAKIAAKSRGRRLSPEARQKVAAARRGRPMPEETRRKLSARFKGRPRVGNYHAWQPEEDALLPHLPVKEIARRTGRSVASVSSRKQYLGIRKVGPANAQGPN